MKKRTKQVVLALGSTVGSALLALLLNQEQDEDQGQSTSTAAPATSALQSQRSSGLRATVVDLLSDVLAETYRKIRVDRSEK